MIDDVIMKYATAIWITCSGLVPPELVATAWTRTIVCAQNTIGSDSHLSFLDDVSWLLNIARFECAELRRNSKPPEDSSNLSRALAQLEPRHRETLILIDFAELDLQQTAAVQGCDIKTVETNYLEAARNLSNVLDQEAA